MGLPSGDIAARLRGGQPPPSIPIMFLRDRWYVAAWGSEVDAAPLARTICGEPIVLYRAGDGTIDINADAPGLAMRRLVAQHRAHWGDRSCRTI
jgi:hypothetical protein